MLIFILFVIVQITAAQKCIYAVDKNNASLSSVKCSNVMSMNDIADEIQKNWTSLEIINKATHSFFSNIAGDNLDNFKDLSIFFTWKKSNKI